jgi:hypothetical protein
MKRHVDKRFSPALIISMAYQLSLSFLPSTLSLFPFYSILAMPAFPRLKCFPDGCDFSQWTGNDSKALMKVNLLIAAY